ncbi:archaetidylserine decarboxylase [soil metagenome]
MAERGPYVPAVSPDLPSLPWRSTLALLERLPQAALSRSLGRIADIRLPRRLRGAIIGSFARAVGIDAAEAEKGVAEYESINDFFVRRLRPGARTWPADDATAASPVDGIIGEHGAITDGRLIQAKGRHYGAADLIGRRDDAVRFDGGAFITVYLSPRHYHRIHAPCAGSITEARYVPGALLPVNRPAVMHIPALFPRNERVLCMIDGPLGRVAVVAVGAYNVGRISTAFDPAWAGPDGSVTNRKAEHAGERRYDPPRAVQQGEEIMAFHLGSTVILLFEPGTRLDAPPPGSEVRLGTIIGRRHAAG